MPTVRIIILLRDPVDRAYSHYHHEVRHKNEKLSFEEAIKAESSRTSGEAQRLESDPSYVSFNYQHFTYVERGIYTTQVQRWLNYFRPSQFLFLSSEEFFEKPAAEFRNVLRFLDLPDWELGSYPAEHVGKYAPMAASTRERLVEFYALHNRTLREQLNSHWPGTGDAIVDRFAGRS